jgi:putative ABC transport system permease protein
MALRELRAAWRRVLFFFLCVAIGVGAIVTMRSVVQSVRAGLHGEARAILAADIVVQTNRPWRDDTLRAIERLTSEASVVDRAESVEIATMVRPADPGRAVARMVELRAVERPFPFYGEIVLQGGRRYDYSLVEGRGALVRPELLAQLGIGVGDTIVIGGAPFTISGVIEREPGRQTGVFSLGPRVLVSLDDLKRTSLLDVGSRVRRQILLRARAEEVAPLSRTLWREVRGAFVSVRNYRDLEDDIGRDFERAENYLGLVGFVILVLGGIGVWSVTRVFVRQKIRSIAILKCVGGTSWQVATVYLLQMLALGALGSLLGVALAAVGIAALPYALGDRLAGVAYGLTGQAVVQGVAVGLLVSMLFSLVPLLDVRHVKPLLLLRSDLAGAPRRRIDWLALAAGVLVAAALVLVASWQAASLRAGAIVTAGFAGVAVVLHLAGLGLVRAVRPLTRSRHFAVRHAVVSLRRPGNQTRVILLAVGLGSFFVIGVRALQTNLLDEFAIELQADAPDLFLIDIQRDQVEGVRAFLTSATGAEPKLVPVLRARVVGVRGRDVTLDGVDDVRRRRGLSREYTITYRDTLEANERLVEGAFWPAARDPDGLAEVSVEAGLRERNSLHLGDIMRFDILGRTFDARVQSVREVDWEDARSGGFMFVFRPGAFDAAPQTAIAFARAPADPGARARLQRDLVARFPNVSAIDAREILITLQDIVSKVTLAVSVVGGLALLSGVLILVGAVAMTKFQRVYEAAVFRTLGASTRTLTAMLAFEYGLLGLLAGTIGASGALVLSWAVSRELLEIRWTPAPVLSAAGVALTAALVTIVGVAASAGVLRKKPLSTLRAE